jgi:co-chaperonin GroES (HSP10)
VIYSKYAGSEVKVDGKELKIVQESEILAIVD